MRSAVANRHSAERTQRTRLKDAQKKTIASGMHFCHRLIGGAGSSMCATSSGGTCSTQCTEVDLCRHAGDHRSQCALEAASVQEMSLVMRCNEIAGQRLQGLDVSLHGE